MKHTTLYKLCHHQGKQTLENIEKVQNNNTSSPQCADLNTPIDN